MEPPLPRLLGDDVQVPCADGRSRRYVNLDYAASTPVMAEVWEAVEAFVPWYSSVHRGTGAKSQLATEAYESAREDVAAFAGARRADEAGDDLARLLVGGGRDLRLGPGPAVDARVEGDERLDHVPDSGQDGCARRVVEVHVPAWQSVGARHLHIGSEEVGRGHEDAHTEILAPAGWGNLG